MVKHRQVWDGDYLVYNMAGMAGPGAARLGRAWQGRQSTVIKF